MIRFPDIFSRSPPFLLAGLLAVVTSILLALCDRTALGRSCGGCVAGQRAGLGRGVGQRPAGLPGRHRPKRSRRLSRQFKGRRDGRCRPRDHADRGRAPRRRGATAVFGGYPARERRHPGDRAGPGHHRHSPDRRGHGRDRGRGRGHDLVETADYAVPQTWTAALDYGLRALQTLPRSRVTVYADTVEVQAIAESAEERTAFLRRLQTDQPEGVSVTLDISAPRPVITPFALRFVIDTAGARFETCTANNDAARDRIVAAAVAAWGGRPLDLRHRAWRAFAAMADAVVAGIEALARLGGGTLAFGGCRCDADRGRGHRAGSLRPNHG